MRGVQGSGLGGLVTRVSVAGSLGTWGSDRLAAVLSQVGLEVKKRLLQACFGVIQTRGIVAAGPSTREWARSAILQARRELARAINRAGERTVGQIFGSMDSVPALRNRCAHSEMGQSSVICSSLDMIYLSQF